MPSNVVSLVEKVGLILINFNNMLAIVLNKAIGRALTIIYRSIESFNAVLVETVIIFEQRRRVIASIYSIALDLRVARS